MRQWRRRLRRGAATRCESSARRPSPARGRTRRRGQSEAGSPPTSWKKKVLCRVGALHGSRSRLCSHRGFLHVFWFFFGLLPGDTEPAPVPGGNGVRFASTERPLFTTRCSRETTRWSQMVDSLETELASSLETELASSLNTHATLCGVPVHTVEMEPWRPRRHGVTPLRFDRAPFIHRADAVHRSTKAVSPCSSRHRRGERGVGPTLSDEITMLGCERTTRGVDHGVD